MESDLIYEFTVHDIQNKKYRTSMFLHIYQIVVQTKCTVKKYTLNPNALLWDFFHTL